MHPPITFWTGVVRIDDVYFRNQTQKIKMGDYAETEFWPAVVSGLRYRDISVSDSS